MRYMGACPGHYSNIIFNYNIDQLTIRDLKTVKKAVWDARTKWMDIGLELDIIQPDLDEINADNHGDIKKCFMEMLTRWLKQVDPPPTWSALVAALQDPIVGEGELAEQVESKFVHPNSNDTTDTGPAPKRRRGEHSLMHGDKITRCTLIPIEISKSGIFCAEMTTDKLGCTHYVKGLAKMHNEAHFSTISTDWL